MFLHLSVSHYVHGGRGGRHAWREGGVPHMRPPLCTSPAMHAPPPHMHPPLPSMPPLPCMPPCHACPLPCTPPPPNTHSCPPATHASPTPPIWSMSGRYASIGMHPCFLRSKHTLDFLDSMHKLQSKDKNAFQ